MTSVWSVMGYYCSSSGTVRVITTRQAAENTAKAQVSPGGAQEGGGGK